MQRMDRLHAWITSRTPQLKVLQTKTFTLKPDPTPHCYHPAHLEGDFSCYGEAVSDDGLLFRGATLPAVQFDAAAPWQENLLVHLDWRVPCELAGCTPHTNTHKHCFRSLLYWFQKNQDTNSRMCFHVSWAQKKRLPEADKSYPPVTISEAIASPH